EEPEDALVLLGQAPVEPADVAVLAIGVVVALLGPADLVAAGDHRDALRQEQDGRHVLDLAAAELVEAGIVARAFDAAVPAVVVVGAVVVPFAVGLVVLLVVRDEVVQREAIVAGDEVDAVDRQMAARLVEIGAAGHA